VDESEALELLRAQCVELGIGLVDALREKDHEVAARALLRSIPNHTLREEQIPEFLLLVLGRQPSAELVENVKVVRRDIRLAEDERIILEERQGLGCALCGSKLTPGSTHVDHIRPIALGGKNELTNYQLLCNRCNVGKGSLLHWVLGIPYASRRMTFTLRYCVLARANKKCEEPGCGYTTHTSTLEVIPRIPIHRGGGLVFDNLQALCEMHFESRQDANFRQARNSLKLSRLTRIWLVVP
jgi:5-methylcytosine-specific restriction endonuclease McrA